MLVYDDHRLLANEIGVIRKHNIYVRLSYVVVQVVFVVNAVHVDAYPTFVRTIHHLLRGLFGEHAHRTTTG